MRSNHIRPNLIAGPFMDVLQYDLGWGVMFGVADAPMIYGRLAVVLKGLRKFRLVLYSGFTCFLSSDSVGSGATNRGLYMFPY